MISFFLSLIISVFLGYQMFQAYLAQRRGSNAFTRFVRDSVSNALQGRYVFISLILGIVFSVTSSIGENQWFAGIPCFIVAIAGIVLMVLSTKNKQRVTDARTVTKGSLEITAATVEPVATVAGTAVGLAYGKPGLGKTVGQAVGHVSGAIAGAAARQMTDVQSLEVQIDTEKLSEILDPDKFMALAQNCGIPIEGKSFQQVAQQVTAYIPDNYRQSFPNLSNEELACKFIQGDMR